MKNYLVSVMLPVFNDEKNILRSIESILNQTYKNLELLVLDDGSTDNTYEILKSVKDNRVFLFKNKKNIGLTKSLNILISKSNGNWIARQDSDDESVLNRIDKQVKFIEKYKLDACTSRAYIKNSRKSIPRFSSYLPYKFVVRYKNPFIHGTLLINKKTLNNVNNYDENFIYAQDYKLFLDLIKEKANIKIMRERLYILNMENNISSNKSDLQKYYFEKAKNNLNYSFDK